MDYLALFSVILCSLLTTAVFIAVPTALFVLLVDWTLGRWLSAGAKCLLWMVVAVRLMLPVLPDMPSSPVSVHNTWYPFFLENTEVEEPSALVDASETTQPTADSLSISAAGEVSDASSGATVVQNNLLSEAEMGGASESESALNGLPSPVVIWFSSIMLIWAIGFCFIFFRAVGGSIRFAWNLQAIAPVGDQAVEDQAMVALLLRVCDQVGVGRRPRLKFVPNLPAPAIFGVFRPTLCLPAESESSLSEQELRLIMIHEVTHVRRRDALMSWFLTLVKAVHWFNPIAWLTLSRIQLYREQACDSAVYERAEPNERNLYTELLLRFSTQRALPNLGLVGLWFTPRRSGLGKRLKAFQNANHSTGKVRGVVSMLVLIVVAVAGLTNPVFSESPGTQGPHPSEEAPRSETMTTNDVGGATKEDAPDKAIVTRVYEVEKALANLKKADPDGDAKKALLSFVTLPLPEAEARQEKRNARKTTPGPAPNASAPGDLSQKAERDAIAKERKKELAAKTRFEGVQLSITTTERSHRYFAGALEGLIKSGPWEVLVEVQFMEDASGLPLQGIDWNTAKRSALPPQFDPDKWIKSKEFIQTSAEEISLSVEAVSRQYSPYRAIVINEKQLKTLKKRSSEHKKAKTLCRPRVRMHSGSPATFLCGGKRPFLVDVEPVIGTFAVAHSPKIVVLDEGVRCDFKGLVLDENTLEVHCRVILSQIDGVGTANFPDQKISVQTPSHTASAISVDCQVKPGQTILIYSPQSTDKDGSKVCYYSLTPSWTPIMRTAKLGEGEERK